VKEELSWTIIRMSDAKRMMCSLVVWIEVLWRESDLRNMVVEKKLV
jgi:hypothetical protein